MKSFFAGLLLFIPFVSLSQDSGAATELVMQAMSDELERSVAELRLNNLEKPYFIQYVLLDEEEYSAEATFGALTSSTQFRQRIAQVQVRVGAYEFDNSEFVVGPSGPPTGVITQAPLEDDYDALRHTLWLATDAAYKQAAEMLARKRAFLENRIQEEQPPDFSKENAAREISPRGAFKFDRDEMEALLRESSRIFRDFPAIQSSSVRLLARLTHRYIVNSEGTRTLQPTVIVSLEADASTQAADGMRLAHTVPFHARSFERLPSKEAFARTIRQLAADLTALRSAPVLASNYAGPVLLTGQASSEMFARVLAPNLFGHRGPMYERQQQGGNESALLDRMNRPVLPEYFSVYDDPAQQRAGGRELIGHYQVDDQGIPASRVSLIEEGLLVDMLMSRRPGRDRHRSNGHGRSGFPGREAAQIGNLFVEAKEGVTYEELKQELIRTATSEKLQYGIIIKSLGPSGRLGTPVMTYKVYVDDGREELVRGASLSGFSVHSLRHIRAAGNDTFVANRLTGVRGAETPVSVIAPSVLLEELELERPSGTQQKPALLNHPYFQN